MANKNIKKTRVSKDPGERRDEILSTAYQIFSEQGYDETTVQQITEKVGVAKGTFYLYFRSKEDMLSELALWFASKILDKLSLQLKKLDDPVEKLRFMYKTVVSEKMNDLALMRAYCEVAFDEKNLVFNEKMNRGFMQSFEPLYSQILKQGMDEGAFDINNPKAIANIIMDLGMGLQKRIVPIILSNVGEEAIWAAIAEESKAVEASIERILGAKEGTLKLYTQ